MISVIFKKKDDYYSEVKVSGHAFQNEPGFDLVCASVSSIMIGALNGFDELVENSVLELVDGSNPHICIQVKEKTSPSELLFRFIFLQLKTIEEVSQDYLKITVKEDKS